MRQVIGIGLFAFFGFLMMGVYPMQWAMRHMARREARALIRARGARAEGVVSFTFALEHGEVVAPGFSWEEEDEFMLRGRLYDVVERQEHEHGVTLLCLPDVEEDEATGFARLLDPYRHRHRTAPLANHAFIKLIAGLFLSPDPMGAAPGPRLAHAYVPMPDGRLLAGHDRALLRPPSA